MLLAHSAWMRRIARGLVFGEAQVDDIVQQAWLQVLQRPPARVTSPRAWLATIMRNIALRRHLVEARGHAHRRKGRRQ
ncbi:MAG: sigma factor [Planctomycetota bacterium]